MIKAGYTKKLDSIIKQRNILLITLFCAGIVIMIMVIIVATKSSSVVIVPSGLQSEIRISSSGEASRSYIEQFTREVMYTMLNITPSSIGYSNRAILKISSPKLHSSLAHQFAVYEKSVIEKNISTYFSLHKITFNSKDNLSVIAEGEVITFIGKEPVARQVRKYSLKYTLNATKLVLIAFKEIEEEELEINSIDFEQYEKDLKEKNEENFEY